MANIKAPPLHINGKHPMPVQSSSFPQKVIYVRYKVNGKGTVVPVFNLFFNDDAELSSTIQFVPRSKNNASQL
jgi:hypothetical protein